MIFPPSIFLGYLIGLVPCAIAHGLIQYWFNKSAADASAADDDDDDDVEQIVISNPAFKKETHIQIYLRAMNILTRLRAEVIECLKNDVPYRINNAADLKELVEILMKCGEFFVNENPRKTCRYPSTVRHPIAYILNLVQDIYVSSSSESAHPRTLHILDAVDMNLYSDIVLSVSPVQLLYLHRLVNEKIAYLVPKLCRQIGRLTVNGLPYLKFYSRIFKRYNAIWSRLSSQSSSLQSYQIKHFIPLPQQEYRHFLINYPVGPIRVYQHPQYDTAEQYGREMVQMLQESFKFNGVNCPRDISDLDADISFLKQPNVCLRLTIEHGCTINVAACFYSISSQIMYINRFGVHKDFTRKGWGARLFYQMVLIAIEFIKERKICYIDIDVDSNNQGGIKFWESMGFVRLKNFYPEHVMQFRMEYRYRFPLRVLFGECGCDRGDCIRRAFYAV